jgi:hypothetical protein
MDESSIGYIRDLSASYMIEKKVYTSFTINILFVFFITHLMFSNIFMFFLLIKSVWSCDGDFLKGNPHILLQTYLYQYIKKGFRCLKSLYKYGIQQSYEGYWDWIQWSI